MTLQSTADDKGQQSTDATQAASRSSSMRSVVANTGWWIFGHLFRMVMTFVVGFWVIRHLGPAKFGELSTIRAIQGILNVLASMGLSQLLPIRLASGNASPSRILTTAGVMRVAGGAIAALVAIPVLRFVQGGEATDWIVISVAALYLLANPLEMLDSWFVSQGQSRYTMFSRMTKLAVGAGLQLAAIAAGFGLLAFVAIDVAGMLVYGGFLVFLMVRYLRPEGDICCDKLEISTLLRKSLPIWAAAVAAMISVKVDQAMIRMMLTPESAGFYAASARLSEFWFFIPVAIITTTVPTLTRQFESNSLGYRRTILKVSSVLTCFSLTVAIGMTMFARPLVMFLFGPEYQSSVGVLVIHVWSLPFLSFLYLSHNLRIIQGQQNSLLRRSIAGAVANVVLNAILIPVYGIQAAAVSTLLSYIVGGIGWDLLIDRSHGLGRIQVTSFLPVHWIGAFRTVMSRLQTAVS